MSISPSPSFDVVDYPVDTIGIPMIRLSGERMRARRRDPLWKLKMQVAVIDWLSRWARRRGHHPFSNTARVYLSHQDGHYEQRPEFLPPVWIPGFDFIRATIRAIQSPDPEDRLPQQIDPSLPVLRIARPVETTWRI